MIPWSKNDSSWGSSKPRSHILLKGVPQLVTQRLTGGSTNKYLLNTHRTPSAILRHQPQRPCHIKRLASIRGAPQVLLALNNEIADLQLAVLTIQGVYQAGHVANDNASASIISTLLQTKDTLNRLVALAIRVQKPTVDGTEASLVVNKLAWVREQSRLNRVHKELHDCRQKLISLTGVLTS